MAAKQDPIRRRRRARADEEPDHPEPLLGTEIEEDDEDELAGPAATAAFDGPPEPLHGS